LQQTDDAYPVLQLTAAGATLLKDSTSFPDLSLSRQRQPLRGKAVRGARDDRVSDGGSWEGVDRALFERLRAMRMRMARARGVPPYVIFHDTTLRDLARKKPRSLAELHHVYGMGDRKIELLGSAVLETIESA
jgi:ATP-dependent DNA helicase RecQ